MVAARRNLLREIRRLAVRDELRAMRTRGRLVVPLVLPPPANPGEKDSPQPPPRRISNRARRNREPRACK